LPPLSVRELAPVIIDDGTNCVVNAPLPEEKQDRQASLTEEKAKASFRNPKFKMAAVFLRPEGTL